MNTYAARAARHAAPAPVQTTTLVGATALMGGGARRPSRGGGLMGGTGAAVGAAIWQTPGGVQSEIAKINADFNIFQEEIKAQALRLGYPGHVEPAAQALVDLYATAWIPLIKEWQKFHADNRGWTDNLWWNHAPEAEQFQAQLLEVRAKAAEAGMKVQSPTPVTFAPSILLDPHKNIVDDAKDATKKGVADLWAILRVALIATLGVAGLVLVLGIAARSRGQRGGY